MDKSNREWIELTAADDHRLSAYKVTPKGESRGTLVVLQEIFGVNKHIQSIADRIAGLGFTAIAPAMYDRARSNVELESDAAGYKAGMALKSQIALDVSLHDVAAALEAAAADQLTGVIGFCWGGSLAWLAANRLQVTATVAYYGGQIGNHLDAAPKKPVLLHFGEKDRSIPLSVAKSVAERYPTVLNHTYDAGHAFNRDGTDAYVADAAALAWRRTVGFLDAAF